MGDVVKEFFSALDKITDILNLGRLVFYTAAGFPPMLALAMILRTIALENRNYWVQFSSDVVACSKNWGVWLAAMITGFMIANVVYARYISILRSRAGSERIRHTGFVYRYPMMRTGRLKRGSQEADFDFAAWLISEYYRYVEIVLYIPYGVLLSLPLLVIYSCARLLLDAQYPARLDAGFFGLGLWLLIAALGWTVWWRDFWLPEIAAGVNQTFELANKELFAGIQEYSNGVADVPDQKAAQS
jgi:hypothetical protein